MFSLTALNDEVGSPKNIAQIFRLPNETGDLGLGLEIGGVAKSIVSFWERFPSFARSSCLREPLMTLSHVLLTLEPPSVFPGKEHCSMAS